MASHKFEDLKKKCEGLKFDPMVQPRVGLTFIMVPDASIIDREASIKATMASKKQTYIITRDFETVIRKIIAKLFCNVYKYVIQIRGKEDGIFLDPNFFSITLNTYYAGGKIDAFRFIKEFRRLSNYNQEWRVLSKMVHAVIVEEPDDIDRPIMEEDGISKPEGLPDSEECNGWCCWRNNVLGNNTGLIFVDPDEGLKKATEDSLFNNEIFNASSNNGEFKKLFGFSERVIPGTNVSISSSNIKKDKTVLNDQSDDFDNGNISFIPKKKVSEDDYACFNGGYNKPKSRRIPQEHQEILYGNKKKKSLTPEQIQKMNDEIEAYETSINKEA